MIIKTHYQVDTLQTAEIKAKKLEKVLLLKVNLKAFLSNLLKQNMNAQRITVMISLKDL